MGNSLREDFRDGGVLRIFGNHVGGWSNVAGVYVTQRWSPRGPVVVVVLLGGTASWSISQDPEN